jgi:CheY-like chemotaxis protein
MTTPATILIVDDDERNRKLINVFAISDGYQTLSAESGNEALTLAVSHKPQLILVDLMMPDMDGFELIRRLKADPVTNVIPIIVVSSLDDAASQQRIIASGADDFLRKPLDRWELSLRICKLLHHA